MKLIRIWLALQVLRVSGKFSFWMLPEAGTPPDQGNNQLSME